MSLRPALILSIATCACKPPDAGMHIEPFEGNPIAPSAPLLPLPSDFYTIDDDTTETGRSLQLPDALLTGGITSRIFDGIDGWSRISPIVTHFSEGVDPDSLPPPFDIASSLLTDSPVMLVDAAAGTLVPSLAELDATTSDSWEQALIVRPLTVLEPDTAYVVLITDSLRGADGSPLQPSPAFEALRDRIPTDNDVVESMREDFTRVSDAIETLGLERESIVQGWSFHTRSRAQVVRPLLSMTDQMMTADLGAFTVVSDEVVDGLREIRGTTEVPKFLDEAGAIELDASGEAVSQGTRDLEILLTIPETVDQTRPAMLFGHGFFSRIDEPTWGLMRRLSIPSRIPTVSTSFDGLNENDQIETFERFADLSRTPVLTAQQLQSQAQFVALGRLVREQLSATITADRGDGPFPVFDDTDVTYMGISNGGTQGLTIMSVAPNIDRGILVVPGGALSHMLQRASQWSTMGMMLANRFDTALDLQASMPLMQLVLDPWDSANYVDHLVQQRFEGRPAVPVVLHEAAEDAQVRNEITHLLARSAGVPVFAPNRYEPWGLETLPPEDHDGTSALYVYDGGFEGLPATNEPPVENGAHEEIREYASYLAHVTAFYETGSITYVCEGPCDPD